MSNYVVPATTTCNETVIKKSRFIAYIAHAANRAEALTFIKQMQSKYSDSRHICWAYVAGEPGNTTDIACNDAGEPSGTAGKPMLNVLQQNAIGEVVTVVIRYFGGIKLGAGGLVRAYSNAVSGALAITTLEEHKDLITVTLRIPFALENMARHCLDLHQAVLLSSQYSDAITLQCRIEKACWSELQKVLVERSNGDISPTFDLE